MSDDLDRPDCIRESTQLQPLSYTLNVNFAPPVKIEQARGIELLGAISRYVDVQNIGLEGHMWTFDGRGACDGLKAAFAANDLSISFNQPQQTAEWCEDRFRWILTSFKKQFNPAVLIGSQAIVRALIDVNGDARIFLSDHVMRIDEGRRGCLNRPIHILGVRLMMPPFKLESDAANEGVPWEADAKAESWMLDPSKLFLEVHAKWPTPKQWGANETDEIVEHLETASTFIKEKLLPFLKFSE